MRDDSPEPPQQLPQQQLPSRPQSGGPLQREPSGGDANGGASGGGAAGEESASVFQLPSASKPAGKVRNIDKMLEQLKREQEAREERERCIREGRPLPPGDPFGPDGRGGDPFGDRGGGRGGGGYGMGPGGMGMMGMGGSMDEGDPFTTNLYVGNLAPEVTEQVGVCGGGA
ncbi:hypothetical protein MNEG_12280 [Monoraphidium neglectum]|uniref:RRM domain-containing protein n=1 Tax=Monoraphidium neglectum TaxID=145388 RepID=A0A0D2J7E7_9CHLO|nr:hypothetical protein MNEG_12280 [Monoraphidium neglectum]KIY95682.1 hypothetical protein MNEG_12280 [Monoraphidium neglectum]|eukprot:XP_013894702.1 hypothetical protein MNEG_12280 [Monoraphidium neglectum]